MLFLRRALAITKITANSNLLFPQENSDCKTDKFGRVKHELFLPYLSILSKYLMCTIVKLIRLKYFGLPCLILNSKNRGKKK